MLHLRLAGVPLLEGAKESAEVIDDEVLDDASPTQDSIAPTAAPVSVVAQPENGATEAEDQSDTKAGGTQVTKAIDTQSTDATSKSRKAHFCRRMLDYMWRTFATPPMVATFLGVVTVFIPPLQEALIEPSGPLRFFGSALETMGDPIVACFTFVMAASLVPSEKLRRRSAFTDVARWPMSPAAVLALCSIRLIVVPAVFFAVWYAVESHLLEKIFGTPTSTPTLVSLVSLIESAAPAANMPVVFLAKMNKHDIATRLAFAYLFMYPLAAFTLTGFSTLALELVVG